MNYEEKKKREFKLNNDLEKFMGEIDNFTKEHESNEAEIDRIYRTVQDFTVDHTTTVKAINSMKTLKEANERIVKKIETREKKIRETKEDLEKIK